jgi:hypothetical protein
MRGHRVAAAAALALLAFPGWFAVEAQAARFSFSAPRVFVPRFRAPVFRAPRVYRMPSVPRRLPVAPQVRRIAPPTSPPTVFKPPPAPRVVPPSVVHNPLPKPSPVAPPVPRLARPAPTNPPAAAPAQGQWRAITPIAVAKPVLISPPAIAHPPSLLQAKPLAPGQWKTLQPAAMAKPSAPSHPALPATPAAGNPTLKPLPPGQWTSIGAASTKSAPSPAIAAPSPSSSIKPPAVGKPGGPSTTSLASAPLTAPASTPAKSSTAPSSGQWTSTPAASNPAASTPTVVAPAPVAAPKTNAPSGYVQIQTSSGPAYFQQTPSGLAIVSDPTTLSKLKNGALPSTVKPYSPSLTFATSPASSAPSNPSTVPSSTPSTSIPAASNPTPPTPPGAAQAPTATASTNVPTGYVQIQTTNGPAYFQQTPTGLAAVSDPTTLSKLKSGTVSSTVQPYSSSLSFANTPAPPKAAPANSGLPPIPNSSVASQNHPTAAAPSQPLSAPSGSSGASKLSNPNELKSPQGTLLAHNSTFAVAGSTPMTAQPNPITTAAGQYLKSNAADMGLEALDQFANKSKMVVAHPLAATAGLLVDPLQSGIAGYAATPLGSDRVSTTLNTIGGAMKGVDNAVIGYTGGTIGLGIGTAAAAPTAAALCTTGVGCPAGVAAAVVLPYGGAVLGSQITNYAWTYSGADTWWDRRIDALTAFADKQAHRYFVPQ